MGPEDLAAQLRSMLGIEKDEKDVSDPTPDYRIAIPAEHHVELYTRVDDAQCGVETECNAGYLDGTDGPVALPPIYIRAHLWRWLGRLFPAVCERRAALMLDEILQPCIQIMCEPYGEGLGNEASKSVVECHEVPAHAERETAFLMQAHAATENRSLLARHQLWSHLATVVPQVRLGNWSIHVNINGMFVYKTTHDFESEQAAAADEVRRLPDAAWDSL